MMKHASLRELPTLPTGFKYRLDLAPAATSRDLKHSARHRWFHFLHSYSHRLVNEILDDWELAEGATLVDNFVGSGTTLLVARERGISGIGYDMSPLSVTVTNAKVASYRPKQLRGQLHQIVTQKQPASPTNHLSSRIIKAFTLPELSEIYQLMNTIQRLPPRARPFFTTALLSTADEFSRAVADGGWLRWKDWPDQGEDVRSTFETRASGMIDDVDAVNWPSNYNPARAQLSDARKLPLKNMAADALITSPPYVNRHDYSRVFHIGLLLLGTTEASITRLRHRSLRSHVEAKNPDRYQPRLEQYEEPLMLKHVLGLLPSDADPRIRPLLTGYVEDVFLSLQEVGRILKIGGKAAYVVGNVRHAGVMVPVDEILKELAPRAGLAFQSAWVMRLRGNSAQQMGAFGREPARESVVFFSKE